MTTILVLAALLLLAVIFVFITAAHKRAERRKQIESRRTSIHLYLDSLNRNINTLDQLFNFHKIIWKAGIQPLLLSPDQYGYFRTSDIENMEKSEVFLGNIYGLWTLPLEKWEQADSESISLVTNQYKNILRQGLRNALKELV
jgi:hypothetical protein